MYCWNFFDLFFCGPCFFVGWSVPVFCFCVTSCGRFVCDAEVLQACFMVCLFCLYAIQLLENLLHVIINIIT